MSPTTTAGQLVSDSRIQPARPPRRWPYVAVVAALVVVVAVLLPTRGAPHVRSPAAPTGGAPPVPTSAAPTTSSASAAPETRFVNVYGVQLPVSRAHGPFRTDGPLVSGFTHDASGAALAAAHYGTRISAQLGPGVYGPTIRRYGLGGSPAVLDALHAQYEQARAAAPTVPDGQPIPSHDNAQALGYRVPAYRPSGPVEVHLLMSGDGPAGSVLVDLPVTVEWTEGTWKVQVPPDGNFPGGPAQSTAGFTRF